MIYNFFTFPVLYVGLSSLSFVVVVVVVNVARRFFFFSFIFLKRVVWLFAPDDWMGDGMDGWLVGERVIYFIRKQVK